MTIKFWLEPMTVVDFLPATAHEIAASMGITPQKALAQLLYYQSKGECKKTDKVVENGNTGRGAHKTKLWVKS